MNKTLPFLLMAFLSSCVTYAPSQNYRPANYSGAPMSITGEIDHLKGLAGSLKIKIDGETVIEGALPSFSSAKEYFGIYKNHKVMASLSSVQTAYSAYVQAIVFINNEKAATLTF